MSNTNVRNTILITILCKDIFTTCIHEILNKNYIYDYIIIHEDCKTHRYLLQY